MSLEKSSHKESLIASNMLSSMSQPAFRRGHEKATRMSQGCVPLKENVWSRHQCLFKGNVGKTKMEKVEGLRILKMRVRESFTHGEGTNTPRASHKGRQPLIECANHDFNIIYFPFLCFLMYFSFLYFFYFFDS